MNERPLNEYLDMEAYDVVSGEKYRELQEQFEALVTLVRIGFLVTVNGEKGRTDVVNDPALRSLLFTILQAKDTATAIAAVASSPASERDT